jgi:hypothetical protein
MEKIQAKKETNINKYAQAEDKKGSLSNTESNNNAVSAITPTHTR